jgi:hypothetical protein
VLASAIPAAPLWPQGRGWQTVETVDDLTGARDRRLILRSADWPDSDSTRAEPRGATLVIACGDRIPGDRGRSLLLFPGQAFLPFANQRAYVELRFDDEPEHRAYYFAIRDLGGATAGPGGTSPRQVAFLGTDPSPYFSSELFTRLMAAQRLSARIRVLGHPENRTVQFDLTGLRGALSALGSCRWPDARPGDTQ